MKARREKDDDESLGQSFATINDVLYASVVLALFVVTAFGRWSELSEVGLFNELAERAIVCIHLTPR